MAVGLTEAGGIFALADHAIGGEKGEIDPGRIHREFGRFLTEVRRIVPGVPLRYAFCDSEAQYLISGLRRSLPPKEEIIVTDCAKRPILDRITFVLSMMNSGKFGLTERCPLLAAGLSEAVWDTDGPGDRRKDNFTSDIDILDAFEYAVERYMKRLS